jgi:N-terminal domain of oxidoreductase
MNVTRITVEHIRVVAEKSFDQVTTAFEQELGQFNEETYKSLAAAEDVEKARAKLEAMVGPSGFMLFRTSDHGSLLRLVGQKKRATQNMHGRMDDRKSYAKPVPLGGVMQAESVATAIASQHPGYSEGEIVLSQTGWRTLTRCRIARTCASSIRP